MVKAGVVGLGWWGQVLVNSIKDSNKIGIDCGYTRTPSNVQAFVEETGVKLHLSYEELLANDAIDAVILATPHSTHLELIILAAEAGKHIFVEKPITLTLKHTKEAIKTARDAGVEIVVGFQRRAHPSMVKALKAVADGTIGRIIHVEGHQSAPGLKLYKPGSWRQEREEQPAGGMTGMGIHLLDSMVSVMGGVTKVNVQSLKIIQDNDSKLDEITSVLMEFENGASGYLGTSIATSPYFSLRFFGETGVVEVRKKDLSEFVLTDPMGEVTVETTDGFNMEKAALEAFADQINGVGSYFITDDEVIKASDAFERIVSAAEN